MRPPGLILSSNCLEHTQVKMPGSRWVCGSSAQGDAGLVTESWTHHTEAVGIDEFPSEDVLMRNRSRTCHSNIQG